MATLKLRYASSPPELEIPQITGEGARILSRLENGESVVVNGVEGSGKTTLALAAMKMLHDQASEVVGVTPSRARADYLNTAKTSRDLPIARPFITPTALAFQMLKQFASNRREQLPEPVLLTGSQEEERIQDLLEQVPNVKWPEYIGPEVRQTEYFRAEVRSLFAACAHWGITSLDLDALGSEYQVPEWRAAAALLSHYEPSFTDNRWDAARMQDRAGQVLGEWGEDASLLSPPHLPDWVIIDDLQDCPASAVRLLIQMARRGAKIFALYNPQAAVETFRGGYPQGAEELARELRCTRITLENSFRETSGGLGLIDPLGKENGSDTAREQKFAEFSTLSSQAQAIADYFRYQHLKRQVPWKDMAIIARTHTQLEEVVSLLQGMEIPVNEQKRPILFKSNQITGALLSLFTLPGQSELAKREARPGTDSSKQDAVTSPSKENILEDKVVNARGKTIRRLLRSPLFSLDSLQMLRLERSLVSAGIALDTKLAGFYSSIGTPRFPLTQIKMVEGGEIFLHCHQVLTAGIGCLSLPPVEALENIWRQLDLENDWYQRALRGERFADQALDAVIALVRHAQIWSERHLNADMSDYCQVLMRQSQAEDVLTGNHGLGSAVALETVFSAAGRSWDTCAVIGMQDGQWPVFSQSGSLMRAEEISDLLHAKALLSPSGKLQLVPGGSRSRALEIERSLARCALSRARSKMLVAVRSDAEETPSIFYENLCKQIEKGKLTVAQYLGNDWDQPAESASEISSENYQQEQLFPSLRSLVGHLRAVLARETDKELRHKALETLAYLSYRGVRAANPNTWRQVGRDKTWWTNSAGLKPAGSRAGISPSALELLNQCEFRWLLSRRGGEAVDATGPAAWGNLIHQIAEEMTDSCLEDRLKFFESHWPQDKVAFFSDKELHRKEEMVRRLSRYLDDHQQPAVTELSSHAFVGDSAVLTARMDRLEAGEEGIRIVDFKTGGDLPADSKMDECLQLACYQLLVAELLTRGDEQSQELLAPLLENVENRIQSASLIDLSNHANKKDVGPEFEKIPKEKSQSPLTDEGRTKLIENILQAAQVVSGAEFKAVENDKCRNCSLRFCCPLMSEGEQVL
ncbi:PD-(D/E)XK nuclease family protein [uncultured Varibaculum sp.]|uniref:PD-(D/E)XK nuclease family protein n=1 Tax=uncultured Varibaculum sp. TaxID=413896 RepID=UPI002592C3CD|nr:PD-(D/E)XK nuclease family protein [uncultured Varibaculum sp.]